MGNTLDLSGLDGSNPLGFLSAIGAFVELASAAPGRFRLSWTAASATWRPQLHSEPSCTASEIATLLSKGLKLGGQKGKEAERLQEKLEKADKIQMKAKKALKDKLDEIKKRNLPRKERQIAITEETEPLIEDYEKKRAEWLVHLEEASPSPELALGKDPAANPGHFQLIARKIAEGQGLSVDRRCGDLITALGCEAVFDEKAMKVRTTPFCFVTGSGHQYFLGTARELLSKVTASRLEQALFTPKPFADEKLSLRWDPLEDRRYALMWADPAGNKAKTSWALNLLAYRGLQLFPSVPCRKGLYTTGFSVHGEALEWTWPLWNAAIGIDTLRSTLALQELQARRPNRRLLQAYGIVEIYRSTRIMVGNPPLHKVNFSPARTV